MAEKNLDGNYWQWEDEARGARVHVDALQARLDAIDAITRTLWDADPFEEPGTFSSAIIDIHHLAAGK